MVSVPTGKLLSNVRENHAQTLGVRLLVICFSAGVGKRSSGALPPVGGAQQSQVAMGGTEALLRRRGGGGGGDRGAASICVS